MGLLDSLSNLDETQTQGLLAASAQMLQNSGPSRTPVGLGAIIGSGLEAYQGSTIAAKKRKMEEEHAKNLAAYQTLQMQEMQGNLQDNAARRDHAADVTNFYKNRAAPSDPSAQSAPGASAMPGTGGNPRIGGPDWLQAYQQSQGGTMPTPQAPSAGQTGPYAERMALADQLRNAGLHGEADSMEEKALKFQPKVKSWEKVKVGGRVLLKPYFEDGSAGAPVTSDVAEKLHFQSIGGKTLGLDPYSGGEVTSFNNTATPGEVLTDRRARAQMAQADSHFKEGQITPQYMETSEGVMALPKKLSPGQVPTGQLVMGPNGAPLEKKQNIPQYVVEGITGNAKSLSSIDAAITSLSTPAGKNAVGFKGYLPNALLNRMDPSGTETRANISDVGSLILHDRSGAAVTAAESPRLMPFIPLATDDDVTAVKKLRRFKQIFESETNNLTFAFPQAKKLAEHAAANSQTGGASADWDDSKVIDFGSLK